MAIFRRLDIIRTPPPCAMLIQVGVIWEIWLDFYSLCAVQKHFRPRGEILHVETKLGQISPSMGDSAIRAILRREWEASGGIRNL